MSVGIKVLIFAYLFILLYIAFVNIVGLDKKIRMRGNGKQIRLKKKCVLFFQSTKNNEPIYYLKTIVLETVAYCLTVITLACFIISIFIDDKVTLIIYALLFLLIISLGIYTGYAKK